MAQLEDLARAAIDREALALRVLVQDLLRTEPDVTSWQRPATGDPQLLAVAAALTELLALRAGQRPPAWTAAVGPLAEPLFLLRSAEKLPRLRKLCEEEAPTPLLKRRVFAPPNFLEFA